VVGKVMQRGRSDEVPTAKRSTQVARIEALNCAERRVREGGLGSVVSSPSGVWGKAPAADGL